MADDCPLFLGRYLILAGEVQSKRTSERYNAEALSVKRL